MQKPSGRSSPPHDGVRKYSTFARDITRAEFGRFYWDDRLAEEVRRDSLKRGKERLRE